MKIHLKDNKIILYDIERDYRQHLFYYDFRMNLKSGGKTCRNYCGKRRLYIFHTINFKALRKNRERRNPRINS